MRALAIGALILTVTLCHGVLQAASLQQGIEAFDRQDFAQAFDIFDELASGGDARATFYLSLLYAKGRGVVSNPEHSQKLLQQAADRGDPLAQYNLGNHFNRAGPARDPRQAVIWWERAAQQGLVLAQHNLGSLYTLGNGIERDLEKARYWYTRAAENGSERSAEALRQIEPSIAVFAGKREPQADRRLDTPSLRTITASWMDERSSRGATLQLVAMRSREDVERLAAAHRWQRPLLLYRVLSGGKELWGLGYGIFDDTRSAKAALPELPASLREGGPWPRTLKDIRKRLLSDN